MQNAPWYPEVSLLTNERDAKRRNTREPLDAHIRSFECADRNEKPFLGFSSQNLTQKPQ